MDCLTLAEMQAMAAEPYEARGILHSEMALIVHTCRRAGIEVVIESGRARGQSTYMLAKYLPGCDIHSIELRNHPDERVARKRLGKFNNVLLLSGDGEELVTAIAGAITRRTAILLDGPKGAAAVSILERAFRFDHVALGFIHDMRKLDHGGPSPHRAAAVSRLSRHAFSDDERIVTACGWMDEKIIAAGGPAGPDHLATYGSYGPTLGVFLNPYH